MFRIDSSFYPDQFSVYCSMWNNMHEEYVSLLAQKVILKNEQKSTKEIEAKLLKLGKKMHAIENLLMHIKPSKVS